MQVTIVKNKTFEETVDLIFIDLMGVMSWTQPRSSPTHNPPQLITYHFESLNKICVNELLVGDFFFFFALYRVRPVAVASF